MRIISINLNGIRSASSKGFYEWLALQDADVICLQELKAQEADMTEQMLKPAGYPRLFPLRRKKRLQRCGHLLPGKASAGHVGSGHCGIRCRRALYLRGLC